MMKYKDDFSFLVGFKKGEHQYFLKISTPREVDAFGNAVFNSETEMVHIWQTENTL